MTRRRGKRAAQSAPEPQGRRASQAGPAALGRGSSLPPPLDVPWPDPGDLDDRELRDALRDVVQDAKAALRDLWSGSLQRFRTDAASFLVDLRRELLRHHRRLLVLARSDAGPGHLIDHLHTEQAELAHRWRSTVLARAALARQALFSPLGFVDILNQRLTLLPERVEAPYDAHTFVGKPSDSLWTSTVRIGMRARRVTRRWVGEPMTPRTVHVRALAEYHLARPDPSRVEAIAAGLILADAHLVGRARSIFEAIVNSHEALVETLKAETASPKEVAIEPAEAMDEAATDASEQPDAVAGQLRELKARMDEELDLALAEVDGIMEDILGRADRLLRPACEQIAKELPLLGTVDLPTRQRARPAAARVHRRGLEELEVRFGAARRTNAATYALLSLELELVGLEARAKDALDQHVSALQSDVRGRSQLQLERIASSLSEAVDGLSQALSSASTGGELEAEIRRILDSVDRVVQKGHRATVQLRDELTDDRALNQVMDGLDRASQTLADRYEIPCGPRVLGEWKLPPPVAVEEVPFRELVHTFADVHIAPALVTRSREFSKRVVPLSTLLSDLDRQLAFNAELSLSELELLRELPIPLETRQLLREILIGALERNREQIKALLASVADWAPELGRQLRSAVLDGLGNLREAFVAAEGVSLRSQLTVQASRRGAERAAELEAGRLRLPSPAAALRNLLGTNRYDNLLRTLGVPRPTRRAVPDPTWFAPPRAADHLPLAYRRLFSAGSMEASDVIAGREVELERVRTMLSGEAGNQLRSVALVGPDGIGKGGVAHSIVRGRGGRQVKQISLTEPTDHATLDELLRGRGENNLVVLSGFQWLISMRPGGFTPLDRLVQAVIGDAGKNAWLLEADDVVWEYASQVAPIADAFPETVVLRPFAPDALRAAILERHGLSGYGISFERPDAGSDGATSAGRSHGLIRRPYESYFRDLHAGSGGLIRDALRLWLASLEAVDEANDLVHVGPVPAAPHVALRKLPDEELLVIYQCARQGWMSPQVHQYLFRVDETAAEAQLARLSHLGLLERRQAGVYQIASHLRGAVHRVLRERGWTQ